MVSISSILYNLSSNEKFITHLRIDNRVLEWIKQYLHNRTQRVKLYNTNQYGVMLIIIIISNTINKPLKFILVKKIAKANYVQRIKTKF